jgi:transcriptional regulator with XRE-family HTH domain
MEKKELGDRIKKARAVATARTKQKFTQQILADMIEVSRSYIGDIESGRTYPTYDVLVKIAQACNIPFDFFSEKPSLGRTIKTWRETKGISLEKISSQTHIPIEELIKIENSDRQDYPNFTWYTIADVLGVPNPLITNTILYDISADYLSGKDTGYDYKGTPESCAKLLDSFSQEGTLYNIEPELRHTTISEEDLNLISRFRNLPPVYQKAVMNTITSFEEIVETQKEQSASKEKEVG